MVSYQPTMLGTRYMCSAGHYFASRAGFDILEAGGNAVDAGVAAAMSLAVLQSDIVNVGGVAPIIIYLAEQDKVVTISGLGHWPKKTDINMFIGPNGGAIPHGVLRSVVPAAPGAWTTALAIRSPSATRCRCGNCSREKQTSIVHRPTVGPPAVESAALTSGWERESGT